MAGLIKSEESVKSGRDETAETQNLSVLNLRRQSPFPHDDDAKKTVLIDNSTTLQLNPIHKLISLSSLPPSLPPPLAENVITRK